MHPVIMRQLAADRIKEMQATAVEKRRAHHARLARRRAASTGLRPSAGGALGADYPGGDGGCPPVMTEPPITSPRLVMAASRPGNDDATALRETADHSS
jgi:hypothetical protein